MRITIPCDCDDEEHEEFIEVEYSFGSMGWNGIYIGDKLPCGREVTEKDINYIVDYIQHYDDDEG